MASLPKTAILSTVEEYLAKERESEERHEYLDGLIYLMAGESPQHADITMNVSRIVSTNLLGSTCRAWSKDTKVRSGPVPNSRYDIKRLYSFPDLVVVCGEPQFLDEHRDVLLNPKVIIEVLSPSTEAFDRGEKFVRYRTHLDSLTDYVVISQSRPLTEHFARGADGQWVIAATATELSDSITISSIGCTLRLSEVYDRIVFPAPSDDEPTPPDENGG